ncbi:MAG: hypothetical protein ACJ8R9_33030 [Steroidobacteraceae bacterium]
MACGGADLARSLAGLISEGAYVTRGEDRYEVGSFKEAMKWLFDQASRGQSVQRGLRPAASPRGAGGHARRELAHCSALMPPCVPDVRRYAPLLRRLDGLCACSRRLGSLACGRPA